MNPQRATLPKLTDRAPLGSLGLAVSPLCVGIVDDPDTILRAYDLGVNAFFVTCDMHWPLYEPTRQGLTRLFARGGKVRDDVVVFGCAYVTQPEFGVMPYREVVMSTPGLERLDVLVAGGAYAADATGRAERLRKLVGDGFVGARAVAVTFHERAAAAAMVDSPLLDALFVRYNAVHPGAFFDFFPSVPAKRKNLVFNFKSTLGYVSEEAAKTAGIPDDVWLPSAADHYRFVLTRPEFDGVLCAPRTPTEMTGIVEALAEGPFNAEDENHFIALAEAVGAKRRVEG